MKVSSSKLGRARHRGSWGGAGCGAMGGAGRRGAGDSVRGAPGGAAWLLASIARSSTWPRGAPRPTPRARALSAHAPTMPACYFTTLTTFLPYGQFTTFYAPICTFSQSRDQRISSMILNYCNLALNDDSFLTQSVTVGT